MWYEWLIIGLIWSLLPIAMLLKRRQDKRFEKWKKEDHEAIEKHLNKEKGINKPNHDRPDIKPIATKKRKIH